MRACTPLACVLVAALLHAGCQSAAPVPSGAQPAAQPAAKPAPPPPSPVFRPGPGIRCDRTSKVCTYDGTASVGLTRLYFGSGAADALERPPAPDPATGIAPPAPEVTDPIFKPSRTQSCDTLVVACYDWDGANVELTRARFGEKAARQLQLRLRSTNDADRIVRYGDTITCDNLAQVCYDRLGAGYGLTRLYLGEPQSERLLARLRVSPQ